MSTPKDTWYDRQALISKLITYAAIFIFIGCVVWGLYVIHTSWDSWQHAAIINLAGISIAAFLVGLSAIIDLLIVNAEALRMSGRE